MDQKGISMIWWSWLEIVIQSLCHSFSKYCRMTALLKLRESRKCSPERECHFSKMTLGRACCLAAKPSLICLHLPHLIFLSHCCSNWTVHPRKPSLFSLYTFPPHYGSLFGSPNSVIQRSSLRVFTSSKTVLSSWISRTYILQCTPVIILTLLL